MDRIDWQIVLELLKIVPPVVVAGIVGWIAFQQLRTAKDKLALDLFDRRFAAHKAITKSITAWTSEPYRNVIEPYIFRPPSEHATQLDREIAEARFLFGQDVRDQLKIVTSQLSKLETAKDAMHNLPINRTDEEGEKAATDLLVAFSTTSDAVSTFDHLAERYMMLDRISVGRPQPRSTPEYAPTLIETLEAVRKQNKKDDSGGRSEGR